jgi:hypothetical protein
MEKLSDSTPDGTSPRTFALNHLRPRSSFKGCSRISDYELLGKLGEGTFGYDFTIAASPADCFNNEIRSFILTTV